MSINKQIDKDIEALHELLTLSENGDYNAYLEAVEAFIDVYNGLAYMELSDNDKDLVDLVIEFSEVIKSSIN